MRYFAWLMFFIATQSYALPEGFVYLEDYAPDIIQDMRYATHHNFVGRPIDGYLKGRCILTKAAAQKLSSVQSALAPLGYGLKVYDCYRPKRAVKDFIAWSQKPNQEAMKGEFYPRVAKRDFFRKGYVAKYSGHSRGSTVDLTMVKLPAKPQAVYHRGDSLQACYAPKEKRFKDNSVDMGTGFDCFDKKSYPSSRRIPKRAYQNRMRLRDVMKAHGFRPYRKEWWHFTLRNEPYRRQYFDFPVA